MTEVLYNASEFLQPAITPHQLTYNEMLQGMQGQLSDKFFYISLILLGYILLNMFVFNEGARFRKYFDAIDGEIPHIGKTKDVIFQVVETTAYMGAIMLVFLNIIYRMGLNI